MINLKTKTFAFSMGLLLLSNSLSLKASIFSDISLPDEEILEILEKGPDWLPKAYKTPIEQGVLLETDNLNKVVPGLSKEQVKFLLGTPTIMDIFHDNRWDYIFYKRDRDGITDPKRITIIFKNEKVGEIYNQDKLISRMGDDIRGDYENAPVLENSTQEVDTFQEIIIAKRLDYLSATRKNKLPVCIDDEFEDYLSQKTLFNADEETLEVRSDSQNQDEAGIFYASGNVEIERANDLIKSDKANFNADTGVLSADGNVKYLTEDLSLYASKGGYNSQNDTVSFQTLLIIFHLRKDLVEENLRIFS